MKKWEVVGADRETGVEKSIVVDAEDEAQATLRANDQGIIVASVRAIELNESSFGNRSTAALASTLPAVAQAETTGQPVAPAPPQTACPRCGCTQITIHKQGFGGGKAAAGATAGVAASILLACFTCGFSLLIGWIGVLAGFIGANQVKAICTRCGFTWTLGKT